ncbi:hypothetical protein N7527_000547 [Penicillium freii]|nr:hypothetical protein N7527_000547 [Penicillium freii]
MTIFCQGTQTLFPTTCSQLIPNVNSADVTGLAAKGLLILAETVSRLEGRFDSGGFRAFGIVVGDADGAAYDFWNAEIRSVDEGE